jgi:hypothetical protein
MPMGNVFSVLLSDSVFVEIALIMIGAFIFGMHTFNRWLHDDNFMAFLGVALMIQAAFYFYNILPHTTVDDQLANLLYSWLTSGLTG